MDENTKPGTVSTGVAVGIALGTAIVGAIAGYNAKQTPAVPTPDDPSKVPPTPPTPPTPPAPPAVVPPLLLPGQKMAIIGGSTYSRVLRDMLKGLFPEVLDDVASKTPDNGWMQSADPSTGAPVPDATLADFAAFAKTPADMVTFFPGMAATKPAVAVFVQGEVLPSDQADLISLTQIWRQAFPETKLVWFVTTGEAIALESNTYVLTSNLSADMAARTAQALAAGAAGLGETQDAITFANDVWPVVYEAQSIVERLRKYSVDVLNTLAYHPFSGKAGP